ncbi:MAG TPA: hypothetical protein VHT68_11230 [Pseudolabrys sp.]|jgi:peptide/nickel transport system substrate-binding protein|nr:hypothetical protein [Pseudolabrys sp.]
MRWKKLFTVAAILLISVTLATGALAQKSGGILRVYHHDSPASMSMLEEATWSVEAPIMAVFNNLVVYKPDERQNRLDTIVPDLATEWSWNADKTALTFKLRQGDDCVMPPIRSRARIGASMRH